MWTKYDFMTSKELRAEILKRGYTCSWSKNKPNYRRILLADDIKNKKPIPYVEDAKALTPQVRYDERSGSYDERSSH